MPGPVTSYSLAGVRRATTRPQEELIQRAARVLSADDRIVAGWLVGGFATGAGDAFSDVDLQCSVRDEALDELKSRWQQIAGKIAPTVRITPFGFGAIGGVCITP